jgi:hypothetical protein
MRKHAGAIEEFVIPCAVVLGFGLLAVAAGQSNGWDLHNYHLYNGWAFWTGRGDRDFAAAQLQTYFNPLLATATYLLFVGTPPWLSTFLLGAVQGANFFPLRVLTRRVLPCAHGGASSWFPTCVALVGVCGATQLSELGGSIGDNLVSLPILCAFALVIRPSELDVARVAGAGLLAGLTTGVKLTVAPFALGSMVAVLLLAWNQRNRWQIIAAAGAALAAGFLACDGFWMLRLYREFGNPLHPMFGDFFGGAYAAPMPTRDMRFIPRNVSEWLLYPLIWVNAPQLVSDSPFYDLRIPSAFLMAPLLLWPCANIDRRVERALLLALAVAYVIWLSLFGIYRYLAPLEMLAPLLLTAALMRLPVRAATVTETILLSVIVVSVIPAALGHLHTRGARYLDTSIPALPSLYNATIILAEDEPLAFLAVGFPPTAHFVRIGGNILGPPYPPYGMDREAARRIATADGPLYALLRNSGSERTNEVLARQHVELDFPCAPVKSNMSSEPVQLCPAHRGTQP